MRRQYLHRNMLSAFFNEKKPLSSMWPVSASAFDSSNPEEKTEAPVSSPRKVLMRLFSSLHHSG